MDGEFDALDFASYVRDRWVAVAIPCGVGVCLAFGVSLLLPWKYTATASILIQSPAGNDPRAAMAVSPVYLESLKSYERFAASNTLFARALDAVHAREGDAGDPIESVKQRVLKVTKPASTALLEISATLGDPKKAQALAQYVAEQTVELNRSLDTQASADLTNEFRTQLKAAKDRYAAAQQARNAFAAATPVESLQNELQDTSDLKYRVESDLAAARTDLADYTAQRQAPPMVPQNQDGDEWLQRHLASTSAKIAALEGQAGELSTTLARKGPQLEVRKARRDALESEEISARRALETATTRMNEMLSSALSHGERLQIIDPGIIPQKPSSPNTMLNVVAALLLSLVGSIVWLVFRFNYARLMSARSEGVYSLRQAG
jgi:capsule polysaccharide export protein KpsE/RkpR